MQNGAANVGNSLAVSEEVRQKLSRWPGLATPKLLLTDASMAVTSLRMWVSLLSEGGGVSRLWSVHQRALLSSNQGHPSAQARARTSLELGWEQP